MVMEMSETKKMMLRNSKSPNSQKKTSAKVFFSQISILITPSYLGFRKSQVDFFAVQLKTGTFKPLIRTEAFGPSLQQIPMKLVDGKYPLRLISWDIFLKIFKGLSV